MARSFRRGETVVDKDGRKYKVRSNKNDGMVDLVDEKGGTHSIFRKLLSKEERAEIGDGDGTRSERSGWKIGVR